MPKRKRLNSSGQWVDIGQEVLKTDVVNHSNIPDPIIAGDDPFLVSDKKGYNTSSGSYIATGIKIEIPKDGTYNFKSSGANDKDTGSSFKAKITKNGQTIGTEISIGTSGGYQEITANNITCAIGDIIEVYIQGSRYSAGYGYHGHAGVLVAYIDWSD